MRAHREHELEQKFVGRQSFAVARSPKLSTNLAELARPIGQHERSAGVAQERPSIRGVALCGGLRVRLDASRTL